MRNNNYLFIFVQICSCKNSYFLAGFLCHFFLLSSLGQTIVQTMCFQFLPWTLRPKGQLLLLEQLIVEGFPLLLSQLEMSMVLVERLWRRQHTTPIHALHLQIPHSRWHHLAVDGEPVHHILESHSAVGAGSSDAAPGCDAFSAEDMIAVI